MQTQKWVNIGLLAAVVFLFLFLNRLTAFVWDVSQFPLFEDWAVSPPQMISFVGASLFGFLVRRNKKANGFLNEVALELSRVSWPHRKETVASAGVVVVLVGLASLIFFVVDTLWGTIIKGSLL